MSPPPLATITIILLLPVPIYHNCHRNSYRICSALWEAVWCTWRTNRPSKTGYKSVRKLQNPNHCCVVEVTATMSSPTSQSTVRWGQKSEDLSATVLAWRHIWGKIVSLPCTAYSRKKRYQLSHWIYPNPINLFALDIVCKLCSPVGPGWDKIIAVENDADKKYNLQRTKDEINHYFILATEQPTHSLHTLLSWVFMTLPYPLGIPM